jgi:UDP-3-O-[3-hydroxymyristoyl] glucosamine N-acyltransferase
MSELGDPRFFQRAGPFTLAVLADAAGAEAPPGALGLSLTGLAPLQTARPDQVSFMHNRKYLAALEATSAGAVLITPDLAPRVPPGTAALVLADPHVGWARIGLLFHPVPPVVGGVHSSAVVHETASIHPSAEIGPLAVIGAHAEIGPRCRVGAGAVVSGGVVMGADCRIGPLATVTHALLGDRVYVYPGARIGQEGFGFAITDAGFVTVPQLGRVILEDDVEIGANSCVDRGGAHDTVIGAGTRIDNMVQIGHGVRMGRYCAMAAQAGLSGSVTVEDFVQIGAQAGFSGHLRVGARARIGPQCGVMSDVDAGTEVIGSPAMPVKEFFRNVAVLRRLARRGPGHT